MSATETERHELYELAKRHVNDRFAELMIKSLPSEPERLATKEDVAFAQAATRADMAELRTELQGDMAELRTELKGEMAELRTELKGEMAELRTDMAAVETRLGERIHTEISMSTRTVVLSLVSSVTALAIANTITLALTR